MKTLILKLTFILTALLLGQLSFAGGVGNGGFVHTCGWNTPNEHYVLVDFDEGAERANEQGLSYTLDLGPKNSSPNEKLDYVLNRLKRLDATRSERYREKAHRLAAEIKKLENNQTSYLVQELGQNRRFIPTNDIGVGTIPSGCWGPNQVFQQRDDAQTFEGDKKFILDLNLWKKLDTTTKAGLIIHEIVYEELLKTRKTNIQITAPSSAARYFTAIISSKEFENLTANKYISIVSRIRLETMDYNGITFYCAYGCTSFENGQFKGGVVLNQNTLFDYTYLPEGKDMKLVDPDPRVKTSVGIIKVGRALWFHKNGQISSVVNNPPIGIINFDENGNLIKN